MNTEIPQAVLKKAQELIESYGNKLEYLGSYENKGVFLFVFPDEDSVGFPHVFLIDAQENVEEVFDFRVFNIINNAK